MYTEVESTSYRYHGRFGLVVLSVSEEGQRCVLSILKSQNGLRETMSKNLRSKHRGHRSPKQMEHFSVSYTQIAFWYPLLANTSTSLHPPLFIKFALDQPNFLRAVLICCTCVLALWVELEGAHDHICGHSRTASSQYKTSTMAPPAVSRCSHQMRFAYSLQRRSTTWLLR